MKTCSFSGLCSLSTPLFTALFTLLTAGCQSSLVVRTKIDTVQTGLFGNDLDKLLAAFEKIEEKKTKLADLEKMGLTLNSPNIEKLEGTKALRAVFGEEPFRNLDLSDPTRHLDEYKEYKLIVIPYKDIKTRTDRIYINRKDTFKKGWDTGLFILLKSDIVMYRDKRNIYIDTHETDRALFQGVVDIFQGINGWSKIFAK